MTLHRSRQGRLSLNREKSLLFYVGASRVRLRLEMFTSMGDDACSNVLKTAPQYKRKIKKRKEILQLN